MVFADIWIMKVKNDDILSRTARMIYLNQLPLEAQLGL